MCPRDGDVPVPGGDALGDASQKLKHIDSSPKGTPRDIEDMKKQVEEEKKDSRKMKKR